MLEVRDMSRGAQLAILTGAGLAFWSTRAMAQAPAAPAPATNAGDFIGLALATIVVIVLFFALDRCFPILRDLPAPDSTNVTPTDRPYTLGRFQMVIWTSIIASAAVYLYLWHHAEMKTPLELISGSAAILLGISGGAGVVSAVIDSSKDAKQASTQQAADSAAGTPVQAALQKQADNLKRAPKKTSFLTDILEDDNGNSLHRVQILIFTLILGFIFCWEVVNQFKMPEFSEGTLALMGISSGVYLGFKLPDKAA